MLYNVYVYVYVYLCKNACVCLNIYMCIYICIYIHTYKHICAWAGCRVRHATLGAVTCRVHASTRQGCTQDMWSCVCVCAHASVFTQTYKQIHTCIYVFVHKIRIHRDIPKYTYTLCMYMCT